MGEKGLSIDEMTSSKISCVHFVASIKRSLALNRDLDHKFYDILNIQEKLGIGRIVVEKDYLGICSEAPSDNESDMDLDKDSKPESSGRGACANCSVSSQLYSTPKGNLCNPCCQYFNFEELGPPPDVWKSVDTGRSFGRRERSRSPRDFRKRSRSRSPRDFRARKRMYSGDDHFMDGYKRSYSKRDRFPLLLRDNYNHRSFSKRAASPEEDYHSFRSKTDDYLQPSRKSDSHDRSSYISPRYEPPNPRESMGGYHTPLLVIGNQSSVEMKFEGTETTAISSCIEKVLAEFDDCDGNTFQRRR